MRERGSEEREGEEAGFVPFFLLLFTFISLAGWQRGARCREWSETGGQTGPSQDQPCSGPAGGFGSPAQGMC